MRRKFSQTFLLDEALRARRRKMRQRQFANGGGSPPAAASSKSTSSNLYERPAFEPLQGAVTNEKAVGTLVRLILSLVQFHNRAPRNAQVSVGCDKWVRDTWVRDKRVRGNLSRSIDMIG